MPLPNALVVWPILFDAVMLESCPCRSSPKRKLVIGVRVEQRAPYSHFKWGGGGVGLSAHDDRCRERLICKFPDSAHASVTFSV